MTIEALANRLYHQLDLPGRSEASDRKVILKALKEAQKIKKKNFRQRQPGS